MGPHPEAPVDVQKYIGSCLITQQTRSKRKSCPRNQHHPKDGGMCGGYMPPCNRCCNTTVQNPGYNISNYAWTGVPLISVARQNKNHHHQGHSGKNRLPPRNNVKQQDYSCPLSVESSSNLEDILPISRLAIHAQGAPLILSPKDIEKHNKDSDGYYSSTAFKGRNFYVEESHSNSRLLMLMPDDAHCYSSREERIGCFIEDDFSVGSDPDLSVNPSRTVSSSPSQSDCISTTSEDSGTSENGLPRIIKPRKRRKKERRTSESDGASSCGSSTMEEMSGTIVTLKPYQPLCYRYDSNGFKIYPSPPLSPKPESGIVRLSNTVERMVRKGRYPYPPSPRCQCPYCVPPPSTFLTPPDSPVDVSENGLSMAMIRRGRGCRSPDITWMPRREMDMKMLTMGAYEEDSNLEESIIKSHNTLVLPSSHPPQRPWIIMNEQELTSSCSFTVMCYNILCDKYATRQIFTLVKDHLMEFNQLAMANAEGSDDMLNRVMTKDNIGLAALLQTKPGAYRDGVIEYLSSGRVSVSHCDFKEFVYKDCLSKFGNAAKTNEFTHPFQISRAYNDGVMPFTNYSYDFKGVIDYIFYSKLHMSVLGVLGPIDSNWLEENRIHGCPHPHVPSDHFPIVVELQLNPTLPIQLSPPNGLVLHR
ncbi:CCR4-NOT transcription complex subunit 6-like [Argiope bruennichi]|uniref:CCR4-NOT transcription complex subunit 6-like n=1 Tax=Argiope bruennichi TaxID=94029 RepID=A0A8T0FDF1_ARGBR|nr:CCR4-NOT transcription complex subunit 6-like [Argiope bruennichi]